MRMPVGKKEIFITFRVGALFAQPLLGPCSPGEDVAESYHERGGSFRGHILLSAFPEQWLPWWGYYICYVQAFVLGVERSQEQRERKKSCKKI